jgi:peptidoglycan hydrolase-like protein with peptidoglycan-binding domain
LGYISKSEVLTGHFGLATETAVKSFQTAKGIEPKGYVGPATRDALNKYR